MHRFNYIIDTKLVLLILNVYIYIQTIENESRKFYMQLANEKIRTHQSFPSMSFSRKGGEV